MYQSVQQPRSRKAPRTLLPSCVCLPWTCLDMLTCIEFEPLTFHDLNIAPILEALAAEGMIISHDIPCSKYNMFVRGMTGRRYVNQDLKQEVTIVNLPGFIMISHTHLAGALRGREREGGVGGRRKVRGHGAFLDLDCSSSDQYTPAFFDLVSAQQSQPVSERKRETTVCLHVLALVWPS